MITTNALPFDCYARALIAQDQHFRSDIASEVLLQCDFKSLLFVVQSYEEVKTIEYLDCADMLGAARKKRNVV